MKSGSQCVARTIKGGRTYELFRHPPSPEFLSIPRFSSDRLLEATFEEVRKTIAIAAPSREYAIFTFLCEQCATWFRENSDAARKEATIVKLDVRPGSKIYVTDLVWRNIAAQVLLMHRWREPDFPFPSSSQLDGLRRVAEAYWQGRDPDAYGLGTIPEALIDGETVVLTDDGCKN